MVLHLHGQTYAIMNHAKIIQVNVSSGVHQILYESRLRQIAADDPNTICFHQGQNLLGNLKDCNQNLEWPSRASTRSP